jgi:hypothetical protein
VQFFSGVGDVKNTAIVIAFATGMFAFGLVVGRHTVPIQIVFPSTVELTAHLNHAGLPKQADCLEWVIEKFGREKATSGLMGVVCNGRN